MNTTTHTTHNHRLAGQATVTPFASVVMAIRLDSTTNQLFKALQDAIEQAGHRRPSCSQLMRLALRQLAEKHRGTQDFGHLVSQVNHLCGQR